MKKEIADLWVADLRTNPPQHQGELKNLNGPGHCCLGRLCVVLGMEQEAVNHHDEEDDFGDEGIGPRELLTRTVIAAAGMRMGNEAGFIQSLSAFMSVDSLAELNDTGRSFAEIADVIEKHWEEL